MLEQEVRDPKWRRFGSLILALGAGLSLALGCLTRYSFGWILIPLLAFLIIFGGPRRFILAIIVFAAFAAVTAPWILCS